MRLQAGVDYELAGAGAFSAISKLCSCEAGVEASSAPSIPSTMDSHVPYRGLFITCLVLLTITLVILVVVMCVKRGLMTQQKLEQGQPILVRQETGQKKPIPVRQPTHMIR